MPRNPDKTDYSHGFPEGFEVFASLSDPRDGGHTLHHFGEILFIAFAGVLCGVRSYELMEEFGELREDWLRKWLKLPNGIPCANTISRVFQAIEPTAFARCIAEHLARLGFAMEGPDRHRWQGPARQSQRRKQPPPRRERLGLRRGNHPRSSVCR